MSSTPLILVLVEHNQQHLKPATVGVLEAARQLQKHLNNNAKIVALVLGSDSGAIAQQVAELKGVDRVIQADNPALANGLAESSAAMIIKICETEKVQAILAPATTFGKNILPRVAADLDVAQISEITKIIDADTFVRPAYAGNVLTTVRSYDPILLITVRATHFNQASKIEQAPVGTASIAVWPSDKMPDFSTLPQSTFVERHETKTERPDLATAEIVVAGGRGLQSAEQFNRLMISLADKLGAAIGASRAAVDAGFAPNDAQVGQTGKVVAPKLYIAVGISGAIQHLAGMKDSQVIVAINKDPGAPIFQFANYGLVGDLFDILPALSAALEKIK
jgi:electron transfer flavoprotein alpha subunit